MKTKWNIRKHKNNVPDRLWDYGLIYEYDIMVRTSRGPDKCTPLERITGENPDIYEFMDYDFYDWVYFWDTSDSQYNPNIGIWLGVSHIVGNCLCYYILK